MTPAKTSTWATVPHGGLHTRIVLSRAAPRSPRALLWWAQFLIVGYLAFGRAFAHLGVAPVYPAEVFLAAACVAGGTAWMQLYLRELSRGWPVAVTMTAFLAWGLYESTRGILDGYSLIESLRGLATHYYMLLFFIGWRLARAANPQWFLKLLMYASAYTAASGVLSVLLSHFGARNPVIGLLLTPPAMPAYTAVGLLAFAPYLPVLFYPLFGGTVAALLLHPGRAAWLSMLIGGGLVLFGAGRGLLRRLLIVAIWIVLLLMTMGSLLPVMEGRGGNLSPQWLIARMVTLVDPETAEQMIAVNGTAADVKEIRSISGTKEWRLRFWNATLDSLEREDLWVAGHGYGYSLGTLIHEDVHTPHNFGIYLLGYTGFIGLILYAGFLLALLAAFRVLPRGPFRLFLIGQLAATLIVASFGNGLETPFVAVPFYLVMGLAYGFARKGAGASIA